MKSTLRWIACLALCASGIIVAGAAAAGRADAAAQAEARVARGKYLVTIGSCNDCHTPWKFNPAKGAPEQDFSRRLSGHPAGAPDPASELKGHDMAVIGPTFTSFRMPFGVVYAANLTPDQSGLGGWTEEMFVNALRKGTHMGGDGRVILPPMPWPMIGQLSDEDLKSVFAYLKSVPAIQNEVPEHKVPLEVINQISVATKQAMRAAGQAGGPL
jgi:cytochrome c553